MKLCLFLITFFLAQCHINASSNDDPLIVDTNFGKIAGRYIDDIAVFTSIPYGGKVDGENRWRDPTYPFPWPGIWDATSTAPGCPQDCDLPSPQYTCPEKQDENCLYLNIYAPKNAKNLPVMVFYHGGDFIQGFAGSLLYDGRFLVNETNIVLVTANYRLHALGYLVYGTGDKAITGNLGLKDQILSLRWVQSNIASFGGDPSRVTIAGQSAGGISTSVIMASVQASGLFQQVIVESNPVGVPLKSMKDALRLGKDFARALGCGIENDYECLYSKNYTEVTTAAMAVDSKVVDPFHLLELFLQWTPVVDGKAIFGQTLNVFEKGMHPDLPLLMGVTAQEGVLFVNEGFDALPEAEYDSLLLAVFGKNYFEVRSMYPPVRGDNKFVAAEMSTDRAFYCPTRRAGQFFSNQTLHLHDAFVYQYVFNQSWSFGDAWKPNFEFCAKFSCHSAELPYVFGTVSLAGYKFTSDEAKLSKSIMIYWGNFVKYGNPNGNFSEKTDLLHWPEYAPYDGWNSMRFKTPENEIVKGYHNNNCEKWDEIGYALGS